MKIIRGGLKPEGEWASLNEIVGKGDGTRTTWETPFAASEARGLHVMRNMNVLAPRNERRVLDPDNKLIRDEPDGYDLVIASPDQPVKIVFQRPVPVGWFVGVSALGRRPEKGEAIKVLPMTDPIAKALDEKVPPELRKRKREDNVALSPMQEMYRVAWEKLAVDFHGFLDQNGDPLPNDSTTKADILSTLGVVYLGAFVMDRANTLQEERQTGRKAELSD